MVGDYVKFQGKFTGAQAQKEIIAATSGKIIGIKKITLTASAVCTIRLQDDGTPNKTLTAIHELIAGVPLELEWNKSDSAAKSGAGKNVNMTTSAGNVAYDGEYWLEP